MKGLDKAAQRSLLTMQLGHVLRTVRDLVDRQQPPGLAEYRVAAARFRRDFDHFMNEVTVFVDVGGYRFDQEYNAIHHGLSHLWQFLGDVTRDQSEPLAAKQGKLRDELQRRQGETLAGIDRVPIEWEPILSAQKTPFSVYLKLRDAIGTAKRRVHYFDRYLDTDFFHLYMRDLGRSLEIRLVTTKGKASGSFGVTNVLAVSRLTAVEFGDYQLIERHQDHMHDRNLRIDDTVFYLGPSISEAGEKPTNFGPGDSTPHGHSVLDGIMAKGTVVT